HPCHRRVGLRQRSRSRAGRSSAMKTPRHLLVACAALLTGCATTGIRVPVMVPAAVNLVQYEHVAVDRFQGDGCEPFSDELAAAPRPTPNPMPGKTAFEVLHRKDIARALDDLRDRHGAEWDARTMEVLNRWRTAQVVLSGTIERHDVQDEVVEQRTMDRQ